MKAYILTPLFVLVFAGITSEAFAERPTTMVDAALLESIFEMETHEKSFYQAGETPQNFEELSLSSSSDNPVIHINTGLEFAPTNEVESHDILSPDWSLPNNHPSSTSF